MGGQSSKPFPPICCKLWLSRVTRSHRPLVQTSVGEGCDGGRVAIQGCVYLGQCSLDQIMLHYMCLTGVGGGVVRFVGRDQVEFV